jgi:hypothetical protein
MGKYDVPEVDAPEVDQLIAGVKVRKERKKVVSKINEKEFTERQFWLDLIEQLEENLYEYIKTNNYEEVGKNEKESEDMTIRLGRTYLLTPHELIEKGSSYFVKCIHKKMPITMGGLAMSLRTTTAQLNRYVWGEIGKNTIKAKAFNHIVSQLRGFVELFYETKAHGGRSHFYIFALKNMGWKDKLEIEDTGSEKVFEIDTVKRIQAHFKSLNLIPKKSKNVKKNERKV